MPEQLSITPDPPPLPVDTPAPQAPPDKLFDAPTTIRGQLALDTDDGA
jgi:hypothetical protein